MHLFIVFLVVSKMGQAGYEAHEWGTFTSLVGSDGKTQNGMYHEDEVLPAFVHGFGETSPEPLPVSSPPPGRCRGKGCFDDWVYDQSSITQKMETPVIYFYSDIPRHVDVSVRFPKGLLTETFPAPISVFPTRANLNTLSNGQATFSVDLRPASTLALPFVAPDNIYGHARKVQSNHVVSGSEVEKFIFYRGLGDFETGRLSLKSAQGALTLTTTKSDAPQAVFLVDVDANANTRFMNLNPGGDYVDASSMAALRTHGLDESIAARREIVRALEKAGLYADEADAMFDTWEHGYLKVPGLRLLYILHRNEVEEILPLQMTPAPTKLERVFVGRIEIMLDTDEVKILQDILAQREHFEVTSLGRFAEPMLRRVSQKYQGGDAEVVKLLSQLVQKAALVQGNATQSLR